MIAPARLPDQDERDRALAALDRNVVVEAGAGTGKTTLLVRRILVHLFTRPKGLGEPVPIGRIVALTFTRKAAAEMKARLRRELERIRGGDPEPLRVLGGIAGLVAPREAPPLASAALRVLEGAQIGTIHSFAAHLLRLHPVEAEVDPRFTEDPGGEFESAFARGWQDWLEGELGGGPQRAPLWREVVAGAGLTGVETLARGLAGENVPLPVVEDPRGRTGERFRAWAEEARALLAAHPSKKRRKVEGSLEEAIRALGDAAQGRFPIEASGDLTDDLGSKPVAGWEAESYGRAAALCGVALQATRVNPALLAKALDLTGPFAEAFRRENRRKGWMSFDGLLVAARDLLVRHGEVREALKSRYRALVLDEFQDTDPLQYEIVFFLAEAAGERAEEWRSVRLEPGKLFIVGDPKQSIYGWRRADVGAYLATKRILVESGALLARLSTSFRSHEGVVRGVNRVFPPLFAQGGGRQAEYAPIEPRLGLPPEIPGPGWALLRFGAEEVGAEAAREEEARGLARWLREEILGTPRRGGVAPELRPGDVAVLLRTRTHLEPYLRAFRDEGIPFVVEGERRFYETQEVRDLENLLSVVDAPQDRLALVGLLRSPLGGMDDPSLARIAQARGGFTLHPFAPEEIPGDLPGRARLVALLDVLRELHEYASGHAPGEIVARTFERLPVLETAAAVAGEQGVANLLKLRRLAEDHARGTDGSLRGFLRFLARSRREAFEEGESPLAEEGAEAVRIMTVHTAKGLEFPVVVLADAGAELGPPGGGGGEGVEHDWETGLAGINLGSLRNAASIVLAAERAAREEAEAVRIFYVAATRARERFVLTTGRRPPHPRSFLGMVERGIGAPLPAEGEVDLGGVPLACRSLPGGEAPLGERAAARAGGAPLSALLPRWERRRTILAASRRPIERTPTGMEGIEKAMLPPEEDPERPRVLGASALARGSLAHRAMEAWDFAKGEGGLDEALRSATASSGDVDEKIAREVRDLLERFARSRTFREEIAPARVVAREVPFSIPRDGTVVSGAIDAILERDGKTLVVDYKTDRVTARQAAKRAEAYASQKEIYLEAVRSLLGEKEAAFRFLFLHPSVLIAPP